MSHTASSDEDQNIASNKSEDFYSPICKEIQTHYFSSTETKLAKGPTHGLTPEAGSCEMGPCLGTVGRPGGNSRSVVLMTPTNWLCLGSSLGSCHCPEADN